MGHKIKFTRELFKCTLLWLIVGGLNKIHQVGNYQDFLKWGEGLLLGRSLIIIKVAHVVNINLFFRADYMETFIPG